MKARLYFSKAAENESSCLSSSIFFLKYETVGCSRCVGVIAFPHTAVARNGVILTKTNFIAVRDTTSCSVAVSVRQEERERERNMQPASVIFMILSVTQCQEI